MIKNRRGKKAKLLKELEATPLISRACKKLGISRSTFYRWCMDDPTFKLDTKTAEETGRENLSDFAESKLLENINANHYPSIVFWLANNRNRYHPRVMKEISNENHRLQHDARSQWRLIWELVETIGIDNIAEGFTEADLERLKEMILNDW